MNTSVERKTCSIVYLYPVYLHATEKKSKNKSHWQLPHMRDIVMRDRNQIPLNNSSPFDPLDKSLLLEYRNISSFKNEEFTNKNAS